MNAYRLYINGERTEHIAQAKTPRAGLTALADLAGLALAAGREMNGRYGKTEDGRTVSALTAPWSRVDSPDARTTRLA